MPGASKLLDQLRHACRIRHYSIRTENTYIYWVKRYVYYHDTLHPNRLKVEHVQAFLTHLAVDRHVAAATQNVALNVLVFLYRHVLQLGLADLGAFTRARRKRRLPVVLTPQEVLSILAHLEGPPRLIVQLLYGSGLRLSEALRLRIKDMDFGYQQIIVREGKGGKDRVTPLPASLTEPLRRQLEQARLYHEAALAAGQGTVYLPDALARKYPQAATAWKEDKETYYESGGDTRQANPNLPCVGPSLAWAGAESNREP